MICYIKGKEKWQNKIELTPPIIKVVVESGGFSLNNRSVLKVSGLATASSLACPGAKTSMKSPATISSCIMQYLLYENKKHPKTSR